MIRKSQKSPQPVAIGGTTSPSADAKNSPGVEPRSKIAFASGRTFVDGNFHSTAKKSMVRLKPAGLRDCFEKVVFSGQRERF